MKNPLAFRQWSVNNTFPVKLISKQSDTPQYTLAEDKLNILVLTSDNVKLESGQTVVEVSWQEYAAFLYNSQYS